MSISFQTNYASLVATQNLDANTNFQTKTIEQLTSGYRINDSGDDAAGLAVANQYGATIAQLTQGVINGNNGSSQLQIIDGGLSNITTILNRLQTLATESASSTFVGSRATLNAEYQTLLGEINRQATNIGLNTGGFNNTNLSTFIGGGTSNPTDQVTVNLAGGSNAVDTTGLGLVASTIAGGGTELTSNVVNLNNTATPFLVSNSQVFNFNIGTAEGNTAVAVTVAGGASGLDGQGVISSLNTSLAQYGISASIANDGTLEFGGSTAFTVSAAAASGGSAVATTDSHAVNTSDYTLDSSTGTGGAFAAFTNGTGASAAETVVFETATGSKSVTLNASNASTLALAEQTLNTALVGTGISAITTPATVASPGGTNNISFQSANSFTVNETVLTPATGDGTGNLFGATGNVAVTGPAATASSIGNALSAITAITQAISNLGLVQGQVGAGENLLQYATNLANSQITNDSAAESSIKDADVATEAANLTKAQVLQQASVAALAQANSAPQALLKLLQ